MQYAVSAILSNNSATDTHKLYSTVLYVQYCTYRLRLYTDYTIVHCSHELQIFRKLSDFSQTFSMKLIVIICNYFTVIVLSTAFTTYFTIKAVYTVFQAEQSQVVDSSNQVCTIQYSGVPMIMWCAWWAWISCYF